MPHRANEALGLLPGGGQGDVELECASEDIKMLKHMRKGIFKPVWLGKSCAILRFDRFMLSFRWCRPAVGMQKLCNCHAAGCGSFTLPKWRRSICRLGFKDHFLFQVAFYHMCVYITFKPRTIETASKNI